VFQDQSLPLSPAAEGESLHAGSTPVAPSAPALSVAGETVPLLAFQAPTGEELVLDPRAALTPAQMVERKLIALLKGAALPLSSAMTEFGGARARRRPRCPDD
jgi:hypothetical protein